LSRAPNAPQNFSSRKIDIRKIDDLQFEILAAPIIAVPGGIRTPNLLIRSQLLYPVELQTHGIAIADCKLQIEKRRFAKFNLESKI